MTTSTGSSGSSGGPVSRLTPLNLFLVRISLPDEAATDPEPGPAATTFQGLNMVAGGQLNMQPFPDE